MRNFLLSVAALAAMVSLSTTTATAGIMGVSGVAGTLASSGSDQLYGWIFTVNSPITVTALGVFDLNNDGLSVAHDVGIFRQSDQSLLASETIPAGVSGFLDGGFEFNNLASALNLGPGTYVIAMTMPTHNADDQFIFATAFSNPAEITYVNSAFDNGSSLAFPNPADNGAFAPGMFGPNFEFTDATPEPASMLLMAGGIAGLLVRRKFKRA
jgi:PEP-CTERM motif